MKKMIFIFCILLLNTLIFGQWSEYGLEEENILDAGIGMTWIDDASYITLTFQPDISIGKLGIGLGVNILYNPETNQIRHEDWDSGYDYARLIRYLRYGYKGDPFYARVGALDAARFGHGFILNYYNNQINYDERKIGLSLDWDLGRMGFESITNNLGRLEVFGFRGYYRPLYESDIPVLRDFTVGASYITDMDPDAWRDTHDGITLWGADVELPLIKMDLFKFITYADHAQIIDYGSGQAIGVRTDLNALWGLLNFSASIERRYMGEEFIAPYFDPFYEHIRYTTKGELVDYYENMGGDPAALSEDMASLPEGSLVTKNMGLSMMNKKVKGWYGGLYLDFIHFIRAIGTFQRLDEQPNSGVLHLGAGLSQNIPILDIEAAYDKRGIEKSKDIFTLDRRSVARVGIGYKIKPYLLLYLDYIWTFKWEEDTRAYKPQERFQPRLAFRYRF